MRPTGSCLALAFLLSAFPNLAAAQHVTKETVPGISTFARVGTTIAYGGATRPEAMGELKRMGYASVIALREATEAGADPFGADVTVQAI